MYLFFSRREMKAHLLSMIMNALAITIILLGIIQPSEPLTFTFLWFIGIILFQLHFLFFPEFIQKKLFKKVSPLEEQLILRKKIIAIQEEIKRINKQPYNIDKFYF